MTDDSPVWRVDQIGPDFVALPRREVVTVEIDGDAILYDELWESTHLLNPTAAIVWRLLDGESQLDELASDLADAFGVAVEDVLGEVVMLVRELGQRGLLKHVMTELVAYRPDSTDAGTL